MKQASGNQETKPSSWVVWSTAARPHTLTASLSPCIVSFASIGSPWQVRLAWLLFCFTVQIGTNLHNDYSDFVQGADTKERVGQPRATAKGWLTPTETCLAATTVLAVTFLSGVYLLWFTREMENSFAWFLVLSSVFNAFAYTGGPYPLGYVGLGNFSIGYAGLGDLFVLLYFGYVAVLMIPYLLHCQGELVDWMSQISLATSVGLLAMNILIVNNLRDCHTDILANKKTTTVRFGRKFSLAEYTLSVVFSYLLVIFDATRLGSLWRLLPLLSLPLAVTETMAVFASEGKSLNKHVGATAGVQFVFCILLGLGCILS